MAEHITAYRSGFEYGRTDITNHLSADEPTGIGLAVLKMGSGERVNVELKNETAFLLMAGTAEIQIEGRTLKMSRSSLFSEQPSCIHACCGGKLEIFALSDTEFTVYESANEKEFPVEVYLPGAGDDEQRGQGQVGGTCHRIVRTIFDATNSHENSDLVLGEVITMQGRWSSYPPHFHPQPEIYHYRFTDPRGWGHAELGENVLKVMQYDTVKITNSLTHAQVAAPGYSMYYSWVIHHLRNNRYTVPVFEEQHQWIMSPDAEYWQPEEVE